MSAAPRAGGVKRSDKKFIFDERAIHNLFLDYGHPKPATDAFIRSTEYGALKGKDLSSYKELMLQELQKSAKNRLWLGNAAGKMSKQVILDATPDWLGRADAAALAMEFRMMSTKLPPELKGLGKDLNPSINGLVDALDPRGLQKKLDFKGWVPDDYVWPKGAAGKAMFRGVTGKVEGVVESMLSVKGVKVGLEQALLGLNALNPKLFKKVTQVRDGVIERLVTPSRETLIAAGQQFSKVLGKVVDASKAAKLLQATGKLVQEIEVALAAQGKTLAPWGKKSVVGFSRAGTRIRGYWSAADYVDPVFNRRWWVHIRKDSLGTGIRVLKSKRVRTALARVGEEVSAITTRSVGLLGQTLRNLHPRAIVGNLSKAINWGGRKLYRRAFGRTIPILQRVRSIGGAISKYFSLAGFVDWIKGKAPAWDFPLSLILPGPLGVVYAIGKFLFGRRKRRKARRRAAALAKQIEDERKRAKEQWEKARREALRKRAVRQKKSAIGRGKFIGRIAAFQTRLS